MPVREKKGEVSFYPKFMSLHFSAFDVSHLGSFFVCWKAGLTFQNQETSHHESTQIIWLQKSKNNKESVRITLLSNTSDSIRQLFKMQDMFPKHKFATWFLHRLLSYLCSRGCGQVQDHKCARLLRYVAEIIQAHRRRALIIPVHSQKIDKTNACHTPCNGQPHLWRTSFEVQEGSKTVLRYMDFCQNFFSRFLLEKGMEKEAKDPHMERGGISHDPQLHVPF